MTGREILSVVYGATFKFDKRALIGELETLTAKVRAEYAAGKRLDPRPRILITGCPIGGGKSGADYRRERRLGGRL